MREVTSNQSEAFLKTLGISILLYIFFSFLLTGIVGYSHLRSIFGQCLVQTTQYRLLRAVIG